VIVRIHKELELEKLNADHMNRPMAIYETIELRASHIDARNRFRQANRVRTNSKTAATIFSS